MAKKDDDDASEELSEEQLAERIQEASQKAKTQWVTGLVMVPILLIVSIVGVLSLVSFHGSTRELESQKPEDLVQIFSARIDVARRQAEEQYAVHSEKMSNGDIFEVSKKFTTLFDVSQTSESDYARLLSTYQQLAYESASRVKGSGEWYFYYKGQVSSLSNAANKREAALITYFNDD
ncbi:hypothetical protein GP2143_05365 [marine gamma proteobacterium HTCC2143]|jgi:ABC-type uncharacterized transport system involved in gliding motility auxiliary subunit|uniref:Uncharacterized protein n=1 Tax=marine gamma proteobacterium HTCC2143 TaxID=247633 RepID=A0YBC3_9GAMM|nr:hypothetical protein GP2143_05365 [marine gamma proteobacterium HTCC2143]